MRENVSPASAKHVMTSSRQTWQRLTDVHDERVLAAGHRSPRSVPVEHLESVKVEGVQESEKTSVSVVGRCDQTTVL